MVMMGALMGPTPSPGSAAQRSAGGMKSCDSCRHLAPVRADSPRSPRSQIGDSPNLDLAVDRDALEERFDLFGGQQGVLCNDDIAVDVLEAFEPAEAA